MTPDATADHFLATYAAGNEPEEGWLFAKALQQCRLDFMPESLPRLDALLQQIRERVKPTTAELESVKGRNFTALLAYYLVALAGGRTGAVLHWHERESALRSLPALSVVPDAPYARLLAVAEDQGAVFWPIAWVEAQLLPEGTRVPAAEYLDNLVLQLEHHGPTVWWTAMGAMGRIAALQMIQASATGNVMPTMLSSVAPDAWENLMTSAAPGESFQSALERGGQRLDANPDGAAWQVLCYDGVLDQGGERLDCLMAVAHTYGERPLRIKIGFPYRPALGGKRFRILAPTLRMADVSPEIVGKFNGALARGLQSVKWPDGQSWESLREGALTAPAPLAVSEPPQPEGGPDGPDGGGSSGDAEGGGDRKNWTMW